MIYLKIYSSIFLLFLVDVFVFYNVIKRLSASRCGVQISPSSNNSYTIMNKGELYQIELQGEMEKIHNARTAAESVGRQVVQAPMPGVILKTYVKKGDLVKRGDPLCVLVAMKMENEIRSVTDGVVKEVFVEDGMKVGLNDRIMVIE